MRKLIVSPRRCDRPAVGPRTCNCNTGRRQSRTSAPLGNRPSQDGDEAKNRRLFYASREKTHRRHGDNKNTPCAAAADRQPGFSLRSTGHIGRHGRDRACPTRSSVFSLAWPGRAPPCGKGPLFLCAT